MCIFKKNRTSNKSISSKEYHSELLSSSSNNYDKVEPFNRFYNKVYKKDLGWNLIAINNVLIFDEWFDSIKKIGSNYYEVYDSNRGYNILNGSQGELMSKLWFKKVNFITTVEDYCNLKNSFFSYKNDSFIDQGFFEVYIEDYGWNFIIEKDKFISNKWVKYPYTTSRAEYDYFNENYLLIESNEEVIINSEKIREYNFIDRHGKLVLKEWVNSYEIERNFFSNKEIYKIKIDGKGYNILDSNGLVSDEWYDDIKKERGLYIVYKKGLGYNVIGKNKKPANEIWYDKEIEEEKYNTFIYKEGLGYNIINSDCKYRYKEWYDSIIKFSDKYYKVYKRDKGYNLVTANGELQSEIWYKNIYMIENGCTVIEVQGKGLNIITADGKLVLDEWVDNLKPYGINSMIIYKK